MKKTKDDLIDGNSHFCQTYIYSHVPLNRISMYHSKLLISCIINMTFSVRFNTVFPLHATQNSNSSSSE
jgi:hypothetical protein